MTEQSKSVGAESASGVLPWKKGVAWWLVLLEGIVLLGLAIYMFFFGASAAVALGWVISLALAITGAINLYVSMQATERTPARQWTMIQGAVGLAAGIIVILLLWFTASNERLAMLVLGLGCLGFGGIGLYMMANKELVALRRLSLFSVIFFLLIGLLLILEWLGIGAAATTFQIVNFVLAIAGIALILWAIMLRNADNNPPATAA